jgi:hypothetical protein
MRGCWRRAPAPDVASLIRGYGGYTVPLGNGCTPTRLFLQLGRRSVAPLPPQAVQRAQRRSLSLLASAPQRIISGTNAIGAE